MTSLKTSYFASVQFNHMQRFLRVQGFSFMYQSSCLVILSGFQYRMLTKILGKQPNLEHVGILRVRMIK